MGFDKNDIMRTAELGVLALVAALLIFFVARPLLKSAAPQPSVTPLMIGASGPGPARAERQHGLRGRGRGPGAARARRRRHHRHRQDRGQVRASSVKKVSEFVERHPEASISIIRNWLHEAT
jgi:flagellar M-ring protein FliF